MKKFSSNTNVNHVIWDYEKQKREEKKIKTTIPFNQEIFDLGKAWFQSGKTLEEAREEMQKNLHFINGYKHGARLQKIAKLDAETPVTPRKR